jgi:hypothetical protein
MTLKTQKTSFESITAINESLREEFDKTKL